MDEVSKNEDELKYITCVNGIHEYILNKLYIHQCSINYTSFIFELTAQSLIIELFALSESKRILD